ncbi:HD domain-containing protein [Marinisporobacter balticus]|uniref:Metal dependent phosphohydrolase n=1 Tax=Marinisporobacter balticus TaxID=2018667 RepID=A0A4R2KU20_9FIRM|nr:HD domain-containing protein [Marinisporobacter balticus]TCO74616.1 metal dependent phosphohydrolase [Marinisporobacter balticus]
MDTLQNIFKDFENHLMSDEKPSHYFNKIFKEKNISHQYPFTMLNNLKKVDQSPKHHPEGNVWNHTMLVVDRAAMKKEKSSNPKVFMWSALLHDLGKVPATKVRKGRITAYDHDKFGEKLSRDFLTVFDVEEDFIHRVSKMVRWHMQILFVVKDLPYADIEKMLNDIHLEDMALLSLCDRLGRGPATEEKVTLEEKNVEMFLQKCRAFKG